VVILGALALALAQADAWRDGTTRHAPAAQPMRLGPAAVAGATMAQPPPMLVRSDLSPADAMLINASVPFSTGPNPAAQPFVLAAAPEDRAHAITCLTAAIYYEAGSQSDAGEAAVAQVVLNRVRHPLFPKSVCGVVFEGSQQATGCQFTFTCDGSLSRRPSAAGWARARAAAERALDGYVMPAVGLSTHYHADYVVPYWSATMAKLTQVGAHIFYSWNGFLERSAGAGDSVVTDESAAWKLGSAKLAADLDAAETAPVVAPPSLITANVTDAEAAVAAPMLAAPDASRAAVAMSAPPSPVELAPPGYFNQPVEADRLHHSMLGP